MKKIKIFEKELIDTLNKIFGKRNKITLRDESYHKIEEGSTEEVAKRLMEKNGRKIQFSRRRKGL